jgi:Fic family protein
MKATRLGDTKAIRKEAFQVKGIRKCKKATRKEAFQVKGIRKCKKATRKEAFQVEDIRKCHKATHKEATQDIQRYRKQVIRQCHKPVIQREVILDIQGDFQHNHNLETYIQILGWPLVLEAQT